MKKPPKVKHKGNRVPAALTAKQRSVCNFEQDFIRVLCLISVLLSSTILSAQLEPDPKRPRLWGLTPQIHAGISNRPNTGFPHMNPQVGLSVAFSQRWLDTERAWVQMLGKPRTGITLGVSDLGNDAKVGHTFSFLPWLEIPISENKWTLGLGYGGSYVNKIFDSETNKKNLAFSTHYNWSYRTFIYRSISNADQADWRIGLGYIHHSNGHTRLPNQGLNSFVLSISNTLEKEPQQASNLEKVLTRDKIKKRFVGIRAGTGWNVLSLDINGTEPVKTLTISYGKEVNRMLRYSAAAYVREYAHYKEFIEGNHPLMILEYSDLKANPRANSLSIGIALEGEFMLNHLGAELDLGLNVFKPAYPLDWKINEGQSENGDYTYGELNWYYDIKHRVSSRLALNYYLFNLEKDHSFNVYISAGLNANLGQADFTELSIGLIHTLN